MRSDNGLLKAGMWCCVLALAIPGTASAASSKWQPEKNVEIIVGTPPGGPLDGTARLLQKLLEKRNIGVPVAVLNKAGGGHAIAMAYLNQHSGDGNYIAMALPNLLTNRIIGSNPLTYTDVTPLAFLTREYIGMSVRSDSPIRDGRELLDRVRADPGSLTFAITSRASGNHLAAGIVMKVAGVDLRRLRFVSFKGASETTMAVLGGHVDVVMATPSSAWKHVRNGKLRMLAISAPKRLAGELAVVPTWKELGIDAVSANWRSVVGPKGLNASQIAYWDETFSQMVKTPEWMHEVSTNQWEDDYMNSADTLKFMREEYRNLEKLLIASGDAKQ